jgi:hypothetical protein
MTNYHANCGEYRAILANMKTATIKPAAPNDHYNDSP